MIIIHNVVCLYVNGWFPGIDAGSVCVCVCGGGSGGGYRGQGVRG